MSDPRFETREALQRWIDAEYGYAARTTDPLHAFEVLLEIQRISRAHAHLLGATPSKGTPNV